MSPYAGLQDDSSNDIEGEGARDGFQLENLAPFSVQAGLALEDVHEGLGLFDDGRNQRPDVCLAESWVETRAPDLPFLAVQAVEIPALGHRTQELSGESGFLQAASDGDLVGDVGFQREADGCRDGPDIHIDHGRAAILQREEPLPVLADIVAKILDKVGVRVPFLVELDDDGDVAKEERVCHDRL